MKPTLLLAVTTENIGDIRRRNLVSYNEKGEQLLFIDANLNYEDLKILIDNNDGIISHIKDKALHWSPADRRDYSDYKNKVDSHIQNTDIHVTLTDKNSWNSKETEEGAQLKANVVKELLDIHINDLDVHVRKREKDRWNNTYTREETSNLIAENESNTSYKAPVNTYDDLVTVYPEAEEGWISCALDSGIWYVYTFIKEESTDPAHPVYRWIRWGRNSVPMASESTSGQMSSNDYIKLSNIEDNANHYVHPDNVNCRHVTDTQIIIWSNKASKDLATIFSPGLLSSSDKEKVDTVEKYANHYVLPDELPPSIIAQDTNNRFVTESQIRRWEDKPTGELANEEHPGMMSSENFIKLFNIEDNANHYVHPLKHSSTDIAQDTLHRFVTDSQITNWNAKEEKVQAQYRADKALEYAKEYTDIQIHQVIGLAPEVMDTFEELANALGNNPNFASDILYKLSNKVETSIYRSHVIDYSTHLTATDRQKFESIEQNANFYTHPETHPAIMIVEAPDRRFITDVERTTWNSKANGNLATESLAGQMAPEMVRKLNSITTTGMITSDWFEEDANSGSYIRNKPVTMPANGGNADTVGKYNKDELINSRKTSTIVIGATSSGFTEKDVDFLCDGTNDSLQITRALDSINEKGGSLLFREGLYLITTQIALSKYNTTLRGSGAVTLECHFETKDAILYITSTYCTVDNINFNNSANSCGIKITGNYNTVRSCTFNHGIGININTGSYNKITESNIYNCTDGISCDILNESSFGNIISNNSITECVIAIGVYSTTDKTNNNNILQGNVIYNSNAVPSKGIIFKNAASVNNNSNNIICGNTIMRGTGLTSDYLWEDSTIRIVQGSYNVISGNVLRGRDAIVDAAQKNIVVNNITV